MKFLVIFGCVLAVISAAPTKEETKKLLDDNVGKLSIVIPAALSVNLADYLPGTPGSISVNNLKSVALDDGSTYDDATKTYEATIKWTSVKGSVDVAGIKGSCTIDEITVELKSPVVADKDDKFKFDATTSSGTLVIGKAECGDEATNTVVNSVIPDANAQLALRATEIGNSVATLLNAARDATGGAFIATPLSVLLLAIALFATLF